MITPSLIGLRLDLGLSAALQLGAPKITKIAPIEDELEFLGPGPCLDREGC